MLRAIERVNRKRDPVLGARWDRANVARLASTPPRALWRWWHRLRGLGLEGSRVGRRIGVRLRLPPQSPKQRAPAVAVALGVVECGNRPLPDPAFLLGPGDTKLADGASRPAI